MSTTIQPGLNKIDKEIELLSRALSQASDDDTNRLLLLTRLGSAYEKRFDIRGQPDDIRKTIEYASAALTLTPDEDPDLLDLLTTLGTAHHQLFECLGEVNDLGKGIEYESLALALTPDGHPNLPPRLSNIAVSYKTRFGHLGELDDLEKAIEYDARAVAAASNGHPSLPDLLNNLGISHYHRFERLGELDDLKEAIRHQSHGVELASKGHPAAVLSRMLANLGVSHSRRFERLGTLADLEKAIQCQSNALALTPDGHPELAIQLANLGTSYSYRFQRLSELIDLDKAIEYRSRALALTPEGHSRLSVWLANLGTSYSHRFQHLGGLDDLEKAIRYRTRALALTHDRHPNLPIWLANLAVSHNSRYERRGGLGDLEKAIEYDSRAVSLTPEGHPDMSGRLANLGTSHRYRFLRLDELGDLEKAIEYSSQAVTLTSDDDPQLPSRLINLGMAYRSLYERLRRLDDLDKAIEHSSYALALTPEGHPGLPAQYFQQALSYLCYYEHTGGSAHLQDALRSFRLASRSSAGAPKDRFQYARLWAKHASEHSLLNCIEAYQTTIDLLPQFVWLGTTSTQRYEDLSRTADLAVEAASAAISSSNYALALEWLEHTRCVVWNQYLMLRSPLDRLQSSHPALAARLYEVAHQLHSASSESRESRALSFDSMAEEQVAREHRRLATEYDKLLTQARSLPDFEDFLRPMQSNGLVRAARNGPIVVINCHRNCCDALIISPQQDFISHLPLPNFTRKKAQGAYSKIEQLLRHRGLRERGIRLLQEAGPEPEDEFRTVLAMLWNDVVKPVLEFLGYMNNVSAESLPHIIWCPTGAASFLPLHAAGDYSQPRSRIFNYAISSYTPTLTALLASTPTSLRCDSRVLAIGQEATPGCTPLPGTAMEIERVKSHTNDKVGYSQLLGSQATTTAVLDAMEQHDWVHLACHAHQDINDPTKSGFFLHDGILDLNTINQRSFKNKGLAFLSACQTATGDDRLPDEAVHLASGMLMAGYSSVIATMWSVADIDAPFVADRVYGQLIKGGKLGSGEAGKALHNAVAELREQIGEKEFERWVPYIHIGS